MKKDKMSFNYKYWLPKLCIFICKPKWLLRHNMLLEDRISCETVLSYFQRNTSEFNQFFQFYVGRNVLSK